MHQRSRRFLLMGHLILPAMLGFGATWLNAAAPASACGDIYANPPQVLPPFAFQNGVRLGLNEADTLKILGQPQERQGPGTRCGSPRERLSYQDKTLLVLDRAIDEAPGGTIRYIPHTAHQTIQPHRTAIARSERVIVRLATHDPELIFSQGIRVGDRVEPLIKAYGEPQSQSNDAEFTTLRYQQHNEILLVTVKQDQITTIELMLQTPSNREPRQSLFNQTHHW
jgi:hypothetical protein